IRVSAGFFVTGLSGKSRIQILPPRFTKRVIATRLASICRSVIHPGSSTLSPTWPKASVLPRQAFPVMRPRCCLRYLTFFGINIKISSQSSAASSQKNRPVSRFLALQSNLGPLTLKRSGAAHFACRRRFALLRRENLAFINPALHADHAVSGTRFCETVVDIGAQCVQRQAPLQIPFRTRDFVAIQPSAYANFDSFATKAQRRIHRLAHRTPEADALFQLQRNRFRNQLRIELRLVDFLDIDMHLARGALLQILFQLVDFRALAPDNDSRTRRLNNDAQLIARTLDLDRAHARRLELFF